MLAADYPIDWGSPTPDPLTAVDSRDGFAAALIEREVLTKNRKALLVFGSAHLYRNRPGTITSLLEDSSKAAAFVVAPVGGPGLPTSIAAIGATADAPALVPVNSALGDLAAADVLERRNKRFQVVNGRPVFDDDGKPVFIPLFEAGVHLRDLVDAFACTLEALTSNFPNQRQRYTRVRSTA